MTARVFVVEDSYQYDGGSVILGIFTDPDKALICQQKNRRHYSRNWRDLAKKRPVIFEARLEAIGIRELNLDEETEDSVDDA